MSNPQMSATAETTDGLRLHRGTPSHGGRQVAARTGTVAAAVLLIIAGVAQILQGISAIETDKIIVTGTQYTYAWSTTGWGVVHIVIGALLITVAAALFTGQMWARIIAIVLAASSMLANFLWLPHYPWWSTLIIALDVFLIWALATWQSPESTKPSRNS